MIRKVLLGAVLLLTIPASVFGQNTNAYFLELGGVSSSFQDVKFSQVRYSGFGASLCLGFEQETTRNIWGISLNIPGTKETASTHSSGRVLTLSPTIQGKYLKALSENLYLGGKWDIVNFNYRNIQGLMNNGNYFMINSALLGSALYRLEKFDLGLDLGLLTFANEGTGFAFSAPQNALENGDFDYQDEALSNPLSFKYAQAQIANKHLSLRTHIVYHLGNRASLGYQWQLRRFSQVKDHPVTMGSSTIVFRWNFRYRSKDAKS